MRRLLFTFALLAGALAVPAVGAAAADGDSAAEQAAEEIAAAQAQANAAAQAWEEARADLDRLAAEEAAVQQDQEALQAQVDELSDTVHEVAINRFVSGSTSGVPLLSGLSGPNDQAQAEVLAAIANDSSAVQLNDWEVASDELAAKNEELQAAQEQTKAAQERLSERQAEAEDLVVHLQEVEAERLQDEAVREELERIRAAERAQAAAEQAAKDREAAQSAALVAAAVPESAGPARGGGAQETTTTAPATTAAPTPAGGDDDSDDDSPQGTSPPAGTTTTEPPEEEDDEDVTYDDNSIVCPAPGSAFGDTWGASRSGGRSHEGVDMMGIRGMSIYAVVSGSVQFKQTSLGGNSAWVNGNNGNRYFYAHLDGFEGSSRSVSQGELIGYMGATGNANGAMHLHFEIHPGGGAAVNPYSAVRAVC